MMAHFCSRRGRSFLLRLLAPGDETALFAMLSGLSSETIYARYLMPLPTLSAEAAYREVYRLFALQQQGGLVLVASEESGGAIVAVAELARNQAAGEQGEVAITVIDAYQREGVGRAVTSQLAVAAPHHGITRVSATVHCDNQAVRRLIGSLNLVYTIDHSGGLLSYTFAAQAIFA